MYFYNSEWLAARCIYPKLHIIWVYQTVYVLYFVFQKRDAEAAELQRQIAEKKAQLQTQNDSNSYESRVNL